MAKSILLDESVESLEVTNPETTAPEKVLRPQLDLPQHLRIFKCSYWAASETKQAQFSGWSPEMGMFARIYGELAEAVFAKYGASKVNGEDTGASVSLLCETHPNSNGLYFEAADDTQRDYVSLNEYSLASVAAWKPVVQLK